MPLKQDELNRQLSHAKKSLEDWSEILKERGVADDQRHRDPVWRSLNAQRKRLSIRMRTSAEVVALDEELKKRKAEKAQIVSAPEETKSKPKKKKDASKKGDKEPKKKETKSKKSGTKDKNLAKKKAKKKAKK